MSELRKEINFENVEIIEGVYHFEGFPFNRNKQIYFRCSKFEEGCKVKVKYENGKYYYTTKFEHNHDPNPIHKIHGDIKKTVSQNLDKQTPKKKIAVTNYIVRTKIYSDNNMKLYVCFFNI